MSDLDRDQLYDAYDKAVWDEMMGNPQEIHERYRTGERGLVVSVPNELLFSWESQKRQYPPQGPVGLSYFCGVVDKNEYVDCLLWRGWSRGLKGVLNHFVFANKFGDEPGDFTVMVDPAWHHLGIGTKLLREAMRRWPPGTETGIDLRRQKYTESGLRLALRILREQQHEET